VLLENADLVAQVTREIRTLSFLLHPPVLDDLGLEYALPWYVKGFSGRSGIPVSVDVPRELGRLPAQVELTLYRTIQEALANVRHHSGSRNASVSLTRERDTIALEIADNGRGFDAGADTARERRAGRRYRRHAGACPPARRGHGDPERRGWNHDPRRFAAEEP
jgi:signal transduction histidine kinase